MKNIFRSKSFWLGLVSVGVGVAEIIAGESTQGINHIGAGLAIIFIRDAVRKIN